MLKKDTPFWEPILQNVSSDSLIIMALLHDLCKVNFYVEGTKNQKNYDPEVIKNSNPRDIKHDSRGDFI